MDISRRIQRESVVCENVLAFKYLLEPVPEMGRMLHAGVWLRVKGKKVRSFIYRPLLGN